MYALHRVSTEKHYYYNNALGSPLFSKNTTDMLTTVSSPFCDMLCFPNALRVIDRIWHDGDVTIAAELIQSHDSTLMGLEKPLVPTILTSHRGIH